MFRSKRPRQFWGTVLGLALGIPIAVWLLTPEGEALRTHGPVMPGHASLTCGECHNAAPGTLRQQVQAKVAHLLGYRHSDVTFGLLAVDNQVCSHCHDRADDRHPIHRFLEPRFEAARQTLAPQTCTSCHAEHVATRVSQPPTFCQTCHADLARDLQPQDDRASPTHAELISSDKWDSCLRCHDYHANHVREVPQHLEAGLAPSLLESYLSGRVMMDPYGERRHAATSAQNSPTSDVANELPKKQLAP